ncbi:putative transcriptional regulator [Lishizhenia tianjinensis]|uniref:Putative transcriptional regulator n=1 Tax=Lishizhenia tianjinensis TaxID=477690 RepID=A0A1I6Z1I6_9FLAO|nr:YqgE/AlgH family protein [Lishizhenia tianjinensis]SFT56549.1 putative transcriptional regulator [Lishizhenia tianjinensis]
MDLSFTNTAQPSKGKILISEPFLDDDYFGRSVILLCEHNEEGSFGFVLNNFIDLDLRDVAKNFPDIETKIGIGGPVETDNIYFIHSRPDLLEDSREVIPNIYIGGSYSKLLHLLDTGELKPNEVRFFLGYSGWSPHQLDQELNEHAWLVTDILAKDIMDIHAGDTLWSKYLKKQGKKYAVMTSFPLNPQDN